jgi:predicted RNase H-like HicB family nuclease
MIASYPIVFETEESGAVSAYVPDLPVYATADSPGATEQAIRDVLAAYLEEHPDLPASRTTVKMARVAATRGQRVVTIVGTSAVMGPTRSRRKLTASVANRTPRPRRTARDR